MSNLVIILSKAILIQIIQTTWIGKNHFSVNISKHKSITFNSILVKINSVKINYIKINSRRRRTKHTLYTIGCNIVNSNSSKETYITIDCENGENEKNEKVCKIKRRKMID